MDDSKLYCRLQRFGDGATLAQAGTGAGVVAYFPARGVVVAGGGAVLVALGQPSLEPAADGRGRRTTAPCPRRRAGRGQGGWRRDVARNENTCTICFYDNLILVVLDMFGLSYFYQPVPAAAPAASRKRSSQKSHFAARSWSALAGERWPSKRSAARDDCWSYVGQTVG
jgi:hypothetical protein